MDQQTNGTNERRSLNDWLFILLVAVIVTACGFWLFNTFIEWRYNAQLLMNPCELCVELNPEWAVCYEEITSIPKSNTVQYIVNDSLINLNPIE